MVALAIHAGFTLKSRNASTILIISFTLLSGEMAAEAASASGRLPVSITIQSRCLVTTTNNSFTQNLAADVLIDCTRGTPYLIESASGDGGVGLNISISANGWGVIQRFSTVPQDSRPALDIDRSESVSVISISF